MEKLQVAYNKTLKLTNALIYELVNDDVQSLDMIIYQMENYIRSKGAAPIGPLVQCTTITVGEDGTVNVKIQLIRQANSYIFKTEPPYTMETTLRCKDCLFVRFHGKEEQLKFAYDKANLISFEEDIPLTGRVFTVFTGNEEQFSADVFAEKNVSK